MSFKAPPIAAVEPAPEISRKTPDFYQVQWGKDLSDHVASRAIEWFEEDLGRESDWTSVSLVEKKAEANLHLVARQKGVVAGLFAAEVVANVAAPQSAWQSLVAEGALVAAGTPIASISGPASSLLTAERVLLNLIGRMSGVATATRQLVDAVAATSCRVYDTRKTVPGWRLLDKYAVRMGGGWNHRLGLYDAILIKDNHLAVLAVAGIGPAEAVRRARTFIAETFPAARAQQMIVEIEIDSIDQMKHLLGVGPGAALATQAPVRLPDILLLDNMSPEQLTECVALRNHTGAAVVLEASGGIGLETIAAIAATGVERVSTGWPTHNAPWLDVALDWTGYG